MDGRGQVVLRYAPGENFNGSLHDIAGVCNERGQRVRADAPPRARGRRADRGSTDGLKIFESMRLAVEGARARTASRWLSRLAPGPPALTPTVEDALALGLTRAEYELVCEKQGAPPNQRGAGDVLAAVERALRLQALEEAAAHAADRGRGTW